MTLAMLGQTTEISQRQTGFELENLSASFICLLIAAIEAVSYAAFRLGFTISHLDIVCQAMALISLLLFFPSLWRQLMLSMKWNIANKLVQSDALLIMGLLVAITTLGCLPVHMELLFTVLGILAVILGIRQLLKLDFKPNWIFWLGSIFLGLWVAGSILTYCHDPLLFELLPLKQKATDTFFNTCISSNWGTYNLQSTGVDGLPYFGYHGASHFIFSRWQNLLNVPPLQFYLVFYPLVIMPLFIKYLMTFAFDIRHFVFRDNQSGTHQISNGFVFWLVLLACLVGFLPGKVENRLGFFFLIDSESYVLAFCFVFITMSLLTILFSSDNKHFESFPLQPITTTILLTIVPALIGLITFTKFTMFFLLMSCSVFLMIRLALYRYWQIWLSLILSSATGFFAIYYSAVYACQGSLKISIFDYINNYVAVHYRAFFFVQFASVWIYVIYDIFKNKINSPLRLKQCLVEKRLLGSELLLVLSTVAFVLANVIELKGAGGDYFLEVQRWVATAMLLACVPNFEILLIRLIRAKKTTRAAIFLPITMFSVFLLVKSLIPIEQSITKNFFWRRLLTRLGGYHEMHCRQLSQEYFLAMKKIMALDITASVNLLGMYAQDRLKEPQMSLAATPNYKFLLFLENLHSYPLEFRQHSLLFIPQKCDLFWTLAPDRYGPFIAPALSGMAMLDGMPPLGLKEKYFGYSSYTARTRNQNEDDLKTKTLCKKAQRLGFSQIVVLDARGSTIESHLLVCQRH